MIFKRLNYVAPVRTSSIHPTVWLGQSVDTSAICSKYPELSGLPFLTSLGCAIRRPSLKRTHFNSQLRSKLGLHGPLMVDSGGFALMINPEARWSRRDVARQIEKLDADIFVSLDLPPTLDDDASDRRRKIKKSAENFERLHEAFPQKTIMPVVHGRTLLEISFSLDLLVTKHVDLSWIGLGGIVPLLQHRFVSKEVAQVGPEGFIARALNMIRVAVPNSKIHAFGAGGMRTFPAVYAFGADSADSIGWRQAAGFGSIFLPLKSQRAIRWNTQKRPPRKVLEKLDLPDLGHCHCPICVTRRGVKERIQYLRGHFHNRAIHNAWITANQFRYWPRSRNLMLDLIGEGKLGRGWADVVM